MIACRMQHETAGMPAVADTGWKYVFTNKVQGGESSYPASRRRDAELTHTITTPNQLHISECTVSPRAGEFAADAIVHHGYAYHILHFSYGATLDGAAL